MIVPDGFQEPAGCSLFSITHSGTSRDPLLKPPMVRVMYTIEINKSGAQEMAQWVRVSAVLVENQVPLTIATSYGSQLPETPAPEKRTFLASVGICTHMNIIPNTHKHT